MLTEWLVIYPLPSGGRFALCNDYSPVTLAVFLFTLGTRQWHSTGVGIDFANKWTTKYEAYRGKLEWSIELSIYSRLTREDWDLLPLEQKGPDGWKLFDLASCERLVLPCLATLDGGRDLGTENKHIGTKCKHILPKGIDASFII